MSKPGVMLYFEIGEMMESMEDSQKARLFEAILAYGKEKQEPLLEDPLLKALWPVLRSYIRRDDEKYERIKAVRSAAANARWHPETVQTDANGCKAMQTMPTTATASSSASASPAAAAAPTTPAAAAAPASPSASGPASGGPYANGTHLPDIAAQYLPYSSNYNQQREERLREKIRQERLVSGRISGSA